MIKAQDIAEATGGTLIPLTIAPGGMPDFSPAEIVFPGISIDSRTIKEGELFLALKGDRFDGHDFVKDALKVAGGALVHRTAQCVMEALSQEPSLHSADYDGRAAAPKVLIAVDDTLRALHDLARFLRKRFAGSVVSVVGSNGKTTTKELICSILETRWNVLKTAGNLNNHIGMPLSMTRISGDTDALVLEMGTNRPGDVDQLCSIGLPDIGVVTNIGYEHIEGFGSIERVRAAELEIAPYVTKLVVNADDAFLMEGVNETFRGTVVTFGIEQPEAEVRAEDTVFSDEGTRFSLVARGEQIAVQLRLAGLFNVYNALAAAAAASTIGFALQEIKAGLEAFGGVALRFEIRRIGGVTYLNDCYNANPSSMEASVKELVRRVQASGPGQQGSRRAIAVLGDMLELGDFAVEAHRKLGAWMAELPVAVVIGAGPLMAHAVAAFTGTALHEDTAENAAAALVSIVKEGDIVLIKGSRGMRMERVLAAVEAAHRGPGRAQQ